MGNFNQQYRKLIAITLFVLIPAIVYAVSYDLFPLRTWNEYIVNRAPINVTAVPISSINKPLRVNREGSIGNSVLVPINAELSGRLSEIYVTEGQSVKAGQPLLQIQGTAISNDGESSSAAPKTGGALQAQDNYDIALKEFNRYQKLYEIGAIPRRQFDNAAARLQEAQASLNGGQNAVTSTNAVTTNGLATIKAPIDGIVSGIAINSEKMIQAGQQLMALGSGQEIDIVIHLDQNDLYLVHLGTSATIEVLNQVILGQVSSIYPEIEANQISSYMAHIKIKNNPESILKPGLAVNVGIDTSQAVTVFAVPNASIIKDEQDRYYIFIAANGKAVRQQISIGELIGDYREITSNIPQESMVIVGNIDQIKNGAAITIIQ